MAMDVVLGVAGPELLVHLFHVCEHLGLFPDMFMELFQGVRCLCMLLEQGDIRNDARRRGRCGSRQRTSRLRPSETPPIGRG